MKMDLIQAAERLQKFREEKKVTQDEAAEYIDVHTRTYQRYESDLRSIKLYDLLRLQKLIGFSLSELIYGVKPEVLNEEEQKLIKAFNGLEQKQKEYYTHIILAEAIKKEMNNTEKIFQNSSNVLEQICSPKF